MTQAFGSWSLVVSLYLAAILTAAVWVMFARPRRRLWIDRELAWLLWHWFTGGPLETGRTFPCQDYRFWRCATRRAEVAAARTTGTAAAVAAGYLYSGAPDGAGFKALVVWGYGGALVLAVSMVAIAFTAVQTAIYLWQVRPLHKAIYKDAGWVDKKGRPNRYSWQYIRAGRARQHGRLGVRVRVSPEFDFTDAKKNHLVNKIEVKLDLGEVDHRWHLAFRGHSVRFFPAKLLPPEVLFTDSDVRTMMEQAALSAPLLGLGRGGVQIARDLDSDSPHVLISAATNGGKSSIIRNIAAQMLWHGADDPNGPTEVWIIDFKQSSHPWTQGLPHVRYARTLPEINALLVELGIDAAARNAAAGRLPLGKKLNLPRRVVVCEELNGTMDLLNAWWRETRPKGQGRTACPGVVALRGMLFMGRSVGYHILAVAQQATARALGGGEARENAQLRILAAYSPQTAKMLVPHLELPAALDHPGWAVVCYGRTFAETQMVLIEEEDANAWLLAKLGPAKLEPATEHVALPPSNTHTGHNAPDDAHFAHQGTGGVLPPIEVESGAEDTLVLVTLADAVKQGIVSCTLEGLKSARKKDPKFPEPTRKGIGSNGGDLFWTEALTRWEQARPRRAAKPKHEAIVYFIAIGGRRNLQYGDQVKIGWTTDLDQRLAQMTLHRDDVIRTVPGDRAVEEQFHNQFRGHRIRRDREWFYCEGSLAKYLGVRHPRQQELTA